MSDTDEPREILASRLIDAWCADKGKQIPWAKAIQIVAIVTNQPDAERDRLLGLGDEDGSCGMCGRSAAPAAPADPEIIAQHDETARLWTGSRSQLPPRYVEVPGRHSVNLPDFDSLVRDCPPAAPAGEPQDEFDPAIAFADYKPLTITRMAKFVDAVGEPDVAGLVERLISAMPEAHGYTHVSHPVTFLHEIAAALAALSQEVERLKAAADGIAIEAITTAASAKMAEQQLAARDAEISALDRAEKGAVEFLERAESAEAELTALRAERNAEIAGLQKNVLTWVERYQQAQKDWDKEHATVDRVLADARANTQRWLDAESELTALNAELAALRAERDVLREQAFYAGWDAGFQEALTPDEHPDRDRSKVAYEAWIADAALRGNEGRGE